MKFSAQKMEEAQTELFAGNVPEMPAVRTLRQKLNTSPKN